MLGLLKNNLFRFNWWLDSNEPRKVKIILIYVLATNALLFIPYFGMFGLISGAISYTAIGLFAIYRAKVLSGRIMYEHSIYALPDEGEIINFTKAYTFYNKYYASQSIVPKGKFRVKKINHMACDFEIELEPIDTLLTVRDKNTNSYIHTSQNFLIRYNNSRKFWKTLSDIREDKLNKIL